MTKIVYCTDAFDFAGALPDTSSSVCLIQLIFEQLILMMMLFVVVL